MSHVLGSEAESMAFTEHGIEYVPAGLAHAVDIQSPVNVPDGVLGYAVCGRAVRVWPSHAFESRGRGVHDQCVVIVDGGDGRARRSAGKTEGPR